MLYLSMQLEAPQIALRWQCNNWLMIYVPTEVMLESLFASSRTEIHFRHRVP